jgi:protein phosphatase
MANRDVTPNRRVGAYYAAGAALLVSAATLSWPWGVPLLWPAVSCAIVAIGYAGAGPRIYRKRDGRLPLITRAIMAPVLLGQDLSLRHYRRHGRPWDQATPELLMGRKLDSAEAEELLASGVTAVLDLTAEFSEVALLRQTAYCNLQILDLTAPTLEQLQSAVEFIRKNAMTGVVYVHCKIGYSRTAAVVGAYLMAAGHATGADDAMAQIRKARSPLVIRPEVAEALRAFHTRCCSQ